MSGISHAVFLSYASQDQAAAQRICDALRAAGIEVWFDQSALRGGDVWDTAIRRQIRTCVLFIPVISRNTHDRDEGYFRLEWKLAVDRSHLMTSNKAFLLPVVIDDTREDDENVPERFRDVHWTRLPAGETPAPFVERVKRLVSPEPAHEPMTALLPPASAAATPPTPPRRLAAASHPGRVLLLAVAVVVAAALTYFAFDRLWLMKRPAPPPAPASAAVSAAATTFAPPPHSIAVLPFVNMSGDKEQDYFSDGLTEELLNSLSRISELQVAARTSAFSFKGKDAKIGTIARELNVASVLEGSVRRSGHTVRITAQLINAVTGFHLWSETYDRDLSDVLKLQTEIATALANALRVTLLGDITARMEVGGTRNPAALDAYLRGSKAYWATVEWMGDHPNEARAVIAAYAEAVRLDPDYALAYASRSLALGSFAGDAAGAWPRAATLSKMQSDARKAITLAPDLAEGHLALASYYEASLEFSAARQEYARAMALGAGNARLLRDYGVFAAKMGETDAGLAAARRSVVLDPLNPFSHVFLGNSLLLARRYDEAAAAYMAAKALNPQSLTINGWLGYAYYGSGKLETARAVCESADEEYTKPTCLAAVYDKLGRHAEAEKIFARFRASQGEAGAVFYAWIYAQWGDTARALDWLETALRRRDAALSWIKALYLFDPLRKEPRFQAIERELKFPT